MLSYVGLAVGRVGTLEPQHSTRFILRYHILLGSLSYSMVLLVLIIELGFLLWKAEGFVVHVDVGNPICLLLLPTNTTSAVTDLVLG